MSWFLRVLLTLYVGLHNFDHISTSATQVTKPRIITKATVIYAAVGLPAALNCKNEGPDIVITWYFNNTLLETNKISSMTILPSGQLFMLKVNDPKTDLTRIGKYHCVATNKVTKEFTVGNIMEVKLATFNGRFTKQPPTRMSRNPGESLRLQCQMAKGNRPKVQLVWKRDNVRLVQNKRVRLNQGNLQIKNLRVSDAGMYVCIGENIAGSGKTQQMMLTIRVKPRITIFPQMTQVEEGEDVTLKCKAEGTPSPVIVWSKENKAKTEPERIELMADQSMKIIGVRLSDAGVYVCKAGNEHGEVTAPVELRVKTKPLFTTTPMDRTVRRGNNVTFRCGASGVPTPEIVWNKVEQKDGIKGLIFSTNTVGRHSVDKNGYLVIRNTDYDDSGEWQCQAINVVARAFTKARLTIIETDPRPPPIIQQGPQNQTLPVGNSARLDCVSLSSPQPRVQWLKNGVAMPMHDYRVSIVNSGSLLIKDLKNSDSGYYTCEASSLTGQTQKSAALVVKDSQNPKVIFHRTPEPSTFPGRPSRPLVSDIRNTSVTLTWTANDHEGASNLKHFMVEYFSHESGQTWVVASDSIKAKRYKVRNLRPDTSYVFLVRALNDHGSSLPSEVSNSARTKGGKPVELAYFDREVVARVLNSEPLIQPVVATRTITHKSITVDWRITKHRKYIQGIYIFIEEMSIDGSRSNPFDINHSTKVNNPTTNSYTLTKLKPETFYNIRVAPFYRSIVGQESVKLRVKTLDTVPRHPPEIVVAELGDEDTVLTLKWTIPDHSGSIEGFQIFLKGNESRFDKKLTVDGDSRSETILNLIPRMLYEVEVLAFNKNGNGVRSQTLHLGKVVSLTSKESNVIKETWFIVGAIVLLGIAVWVVVCLTGAWFYKAKKGKCKKQAACSEEDDRIGTYMNTPSFIKSNVQNVDSIRYAGDTQRTVVAPMSNNHQAYGAPTGLPHQPHHQQTSPPQQQHQQTYNTLVASGYTMEPHQMDNVYNTPDIQRPYYANPHQASAYATTTLISDPQPYCGPVYNSNDNSTSGGGQGSQPTPHMQRSWGQDSDSEIDEGSAAIAADFVRMDCDFSNTHDPERQPMIPDQSYVHEPLAALFMPPPPPINPEDPPTPQPTHRPYSARNHRNGSISRGRKHADNSPMNKTPTPPQRHNFRLPLREEESRNYETDNLMSSYDDDIGSNICDADSVANAALHSSWTDADTTLDESRRSYNNVGGGQGGGSSVSSHDDSDNNNSEFCADSDFAEAVVRAAERDGLTVINGAVHPQNSVLNNSSRNQPNYNNDDKINARNKQRPEIKSKPSFNKECRTNPMNAFDTRNTPIV